MLLKSTLLCTLLLVSLATAWQDDDGCFRYIYANKSSNAEAQYLADAQEVKSLPGLTKSIKFRHYSGYLNVSSTRRLHYWCVE